jgi:2-iminobutanoate/2-iminopropanoate deaminase
MRGRDAWGDQPVTDSLVPVQTLSLPGNHAIGPYSDAVKVGNLVFASGRIGLRNADMQLVDGGVSEQTQQCLANIAEVLEMAGSALGKVVKSTVFLTDMADFAAMNAEYAAAFPEQRPARSTVAVAGLPMGALVEIEVIAVQ